MNPKALFEAVRRIAGRGLSQAEVDAVNAAIGVQPDPPSAPEQPVTPTQISTAGINLIQQFEGYAKALPDGRCQAYPDPGPTGLPVTIGWGATTDELGKAIPLGTIWTRTQADRRFKQHLGQFEREVIAALGSAIHATSQPQFDALVSFAFNVGPENLRSSTLLRKHKAGDYAGAAAEFARWNRAGGKVLPGLTRRRAAEAAMYRSGSR